MPYYVYAIELNKTVLNKRKFSKANPDRNSTKPCLYVGSSFFAPKERYRRHLEGNAGSKWVKEFHVRLYDKYTANLPGYMTRSEGERAEFLHAKWMRKKGFAVWTNLPSMPVQYKKTHFSTDIWNGAPAQFAIITAHGTAGETWSERKNIAADSHLGEKLAELCDWTNRITAYSPTSEGTEPGWAAAIEFEAACNLGLRFKQDVIYWVQDDNLYLSYCDARCALVPVGKFHERLHVSP